MPRRLKIVMAGAGHAHLLALRDLARLAPEDISLTVVTPASEMLYSGMIPGLVAGHFSRDDLAIPVAPLADGCQADLILDEVVALDPAGCRLVLRGGAELAYDILSIDVGSVTAIDEVPGATEHAVPVRPLAGLVEAVARLESRRPRSSGPPVAVVGAGAAGVEIVLALDHRLNSESPSADKVPLALLSGSSGILESFPPAVQRRFVRLLRDRGIALHVGAPVSQVQADAAVTADGRYLPVAAVLWAGHAAPHAWLARSGLEVDGRGFPRVDARLRARGRNNVLITGDAASFDPRPLPKSGVHAVRQGEMLAGSLVALARGEEPPAYVPQRDALYILTTGGRHAVATRNGLGLAGSWVWYWKRWIDTRFVNRLRSAMSR